MRFFGLGFLMNQYPWGMIKLSILSFPIFGDFNELLANPVLLVTYIDAASKKKCS